MFHNIKIFELSPDILAKLLGCSCRTCIQLYDTELELEGNLIVLTTESSVFEITETALGFLLIKISVTSQKA